MKARIGAAVCAFVALTALFYAAFASLDEAEAEKAQSRSPVAAVSPPIAQQLAAASQAAASHNPARIVAGRLQALARCEQQPQNCNLDNSDPRAAHFDLGRRMAAELGHLAMLARAGARMDEVDGAGIARNHMQNENGHVQEAALELMSALPPDSANADAILTALQQGHDAQIYAQAMRELQRYPDSGVRSRVESTLVETLQTGGHFAGQAVAQDILPFLDSGNVARFQELAEQLPPGSAKRRLLEGTLQEFRLRQSGG